MVDEKMAPNDAIIVSVSVLCSFPTFSESLLRHLFEEVMLEHGRELLKQGRVDILAIKNVVDVGALARNLTCNGNNGNSLLAHHLFDSLSNVHSSYVI